MPERTTQSSPGIGSKITNLLEEHPILVAGIVAGAALGIIVFINKTKGSSNTITGVPTDASGNPIGGGFGVSPGMSQTDLTTQFQDLEQQILDWEKNFKGTQGNAGPPGPPGPPGNGGGGGGNKDTTPFSGLWSVWKKYLAPIPAPNNPDQGGFYTVPHDETAAELATFLGAHTGIKESWVSIAYNPWNFPLNLRGDIQNHTQGQTVVIPGGTQVFLPSSMFTT